MTILGFQIKSLPSKYLYVPLMVQAWKKSNWDKFISNLEDRVKRWMVIALNLASRLVLGKEILQVISGYMLSILPSPNGVLQKIREVQRSFLWQGVEGKKKMGISALEYYM